MKLNINLVKNRLFQSLWHEPQTTEKQQKKLRQNNALSLLL